MKSNPSESSAYDWLAAILRGEQPTWPCDENDVDGNRLWDVGLENGVLALCHEQLKGTPLWEQLPDDFSTRLTDHTKQEAATELLRHQALKQALGLFHEQDLEYLLMKGTPLAFSHYPQPYLRPRVDTDLLFPDKETAEQAWMIMKDLGYERPNAVSGELISYEFFCYKPGKLGPTSTLDLHWRVNNRQRFARALSFKELKENAAPVLALGNEVMTLSPVDALLLACMHRIANQPEGLENRLIWLYDIHLLVSAMSESGLKNLATKTIEKSLCGIILDGLNQCHQAFNTKIPGDIKLRLEEGKSQEVDSDDIGKNRLRMEVENFRSLPGTRERLGLLKEHLFPNTEYMFRKYHTRNYLLLPLLYLYRVIQGTIKLVR